MYDCCTMCTPSAIFPCKIQLLSFPIKLLPAGFVFIIGTCKMKDFRTNNLSFQLVWRIPHFLCQFSVRAPSWREVSPEKNTSPFFWHEGGRSKQLQWDSYIGYWQSTASANTGCVSLHPSVSWTVKGNITLKWITEFWGRYSPYLPRFFSLYKLE